MPVSSGLSKRLARSEDTEKIASLLPSLAGPFFAERFPGQTVADFCRWKYFDNPLGDAAVGIALDEGRVVGLAAAVPKRVQVGSEVVSAYELGDFITAPEYRNHGIFSALIELICERAAERGAVFAYVRPNSVSFPILAHRLNFYEAQKIDSRQYIFPSGLLHRKTGLPPGICRRSGIDWLARRILLPSSRALDVTPIQRFNAEFDSFWEKVRPHYSFSLVRDSRYLNWRYADCPTPYSLWLARRGGEVAGYLVSFTNRAEGRSYIVDVLTHPEDATAASALLGAGFDDILSTGVQAVETWTLQCGASSAGWRRLKRTCPVTSKPHLHMAVRFLGTHMGPSDLPAGQWQLTLGDFDGI